MLIMSGDAFDILTFMDNTGQHWTQKQRRNTIEALLKKMKNEQFDGEEEAYRALNFVNLAHSLGHKHQINEFLSQAIETLGSGRADDASAAVAKHNEKQRR